MNNQNYYILHCSAAHPEASLKRKRSPYTLHPWTTGKPLPFTPETPITYTIDISEFEQCEEDLEDANLLDYTPDDLNLPSYTEYCNPALMSKELVNTIQSVDDIRIEQFPAEIFNNFSKTRNVDYVAVNLIGVAEVEVSRELNKPPSRRLFKLPVPEYLMFHLYEDGPIVVHESVRRVIEKSGFYDIYFTATNEEC